MKQLSIIPIVLLIASVIISCTKESAVGETLPAPTLQVPLQSLPQPVKIISQWFNPVFEIINERNVVYLKAQQFSATSLSYDKATHVELAFIKLNYQGSSVTRRLPIMLSCSHVISNEFCEIDFGIGNTGYEVSIKNADRNSLPVIVTNPFPDMQIRYLVVPKTLFDSFNINWNDYSAVAQALNI